MRITRRRRLMWGVGLAGLIVMIAAGQWVEGRSDVQYRTVPAGRGDIDVAVSATGTPNAVVTVQVGSQVSGNIQALFADFNSKVAKGELIAQIDPAPFQTKVNQAQATLDAARASVANSQAVVQQALANTDTTVANYRQTVLTGFQQVEDALAALRILAQETDIVAQAVSAAQQSLDIPTIQYRGGLANYLQVITARDEPAPESACEC